MGEMQRRDHALPPAASDRIATGVPQLERILGGGIPRYSLIFVAGLPGTGKSILSQQIAFANAQQGNKCLYFSTFGEPAVKLLRYLQHFSFFDPALFGTQVVYGDLGDRLASSDSALLLQHIDELVRSQRPAVVVIDSFKALRDRIPDPFAFRQFTLELAVRMATWEVTTLLVGEYSEADLRREAEFAIADGILYLYGTEEAERQQRYLRVMKMRGTAAYGGEHFFAIDQSGISVFPRMTPQVTGEYQLSDERTGSLVSGLNDLLGGGLYTASTTLIAGASGSGKSLVALSFLVDYCQRGRPGLLVSFEESPNQLIRNAAAFGWDLADLIGRGLLDIFHVSPAELNIDRHAFHIQNRIEQIGAGMLVIDSITTFEGAAASPTKYKNYVWAIADYCKRSGIGCLLTTELSDSAQLLQVGHQEISFIADAIILLRYQEDADSINRTLTVLKMRGSRHARTVHMLQIDPPQIRVEAQNVQTAPHSDNPFINELER